MQVKPLALMTPAWTAMAAALVARWDLAQIDDPPGRDAAAAAQKISSTSATQISSQEFPQQNGSTRQTSAARFWEDVGRQPIIDEDDPSAEPVVQALCGSAQSGKVGEGMGHAIVGQMQFL